MGYDYSASGDILILSKNFEAAANAVRHTLKWLSSTTLPNILTEIGWETHYAEGDLTYLSWRYGSGGSTNEILLEAIAPYVEPLTRAGLPAEIVADAEDSANWQWVFKRGKLVKQDLIYVYTDLDMVYQLLERFPGGITLDNLKAALELQDMVDS